MTLVSVICSAYNSEDTIATAIESLRKQSHRDLEIIVVDDASTDRTGLVLEDFCRLDSRVKVIRNRKNLGLTKSLNIALSLATGEYIARQDADDQSYPTRLATQLHVARATGAGFVVSRYHRSGTRSHPMFAHRWVKLQHMKLGNFLCHGTIFLHCSVFDQIGGYDENYLYSQDAEFVLRYLKNGEKIRLVQKPLYNFTRSESSISSRKEAEQMQCLQAAYTQHSVRIHSAKLSRFAKIILRNFLP